MKSSTMRFCVALPVGGLAGAVLWTALSVAAAAPLQWDADANGANGANGGNGTWDTGPTANWYPGSGTLDVPWATPGPDDAIFGGTAGTVSITAAGVAARSLTFDTAGYVLQDGTLNMLGTDLVANASARIDSVIGGLDLNKSGTGTLTLGGANVHTGTTTVSNGTLLVANNSALGTTAGGTLVAPDAGVSSTLDLAAGVTVTGETLTLRAHSSGDRAWLNGPTSGSATWAGNIVVDSGFAGEFLNTRGGDLHVTGNVTNTGSASSQLWIRGSSGEGFITGSISLLGSLRKIDAGTWTLSGTGSSYPQLYINNGTLRMGAAGVLPASAYINFQNDATAKVIDLAGFDQTVKGLSASGAGTVTSATPATLTINTAGSSYAYSGLLTGALSLVKTGTGTQTLSGANTYTGLTTIDQGTLQLAGGDNRIATGNALRINANGTFDLNGQNQALNSVTCAHGTILLSGGAMFTVGNGDFWASTTVTGTGGLVKNTGGDLTYGAGTSNYTGGTYIQAGRLWLYYGNNKLPVTGDVTIDGPGTLDLAHPNTPGSVQTIGGLFGAGKVTIGNAGTAVNFVVGNGDRDGDFSGVIQNGNGTLSLTKIGGGTQTLSGANTYTGTTTVDGGILALAGSSGSTIHGDVTVNAGASLRLDNRNVLGTGTAITLDGGTFNLNGNFDYFHSLTMSNNAQVTGSGWFILNDTSGDVTTTGAGNAGTIAATMAIASPYASSTGPRTQNFNIAAGTTLTVSGTIINTGEGTTYTGSIRKSGGGTLILSGANTYSGTTTVDGGILAVAGAPGSTIHGDVTVNGGATLRLDNRNVLGPGTAITLNGGTFDLQGNFDYFHSLTMSNDAQVTGSGWFILNDTSGDVTTTGTGNAGTIAARMAIAAPYAASTGPRTQNFNIAAGTSLAVSGAIINTGEGTSYTGSIFKSGGGTLVLSGANSYSGLTTIDQGTLQLAGGDNRIATGNSLRINSAGIFDLNGQNQALNFVTCAHGTILLNGGAMFTVGSGDFWGASTVTGTGGLVKNTGGTLTYGANNSNYTGGTYIQAGKLWLYYGNNKLPTTGDVTIDGPGTLDLAHPNTPGSVQTIGGLFGAGKVTIGNAGTAVNFVVGNGDRSGDFSGVIENGNGTLSLTKTGTGTQILSGANTYTGTTTVDGGILAVAGSGPSTIHGDVTVNAGATLRLDYRNVLGTGTALSLNGGTFDLQGNFDYFHSLTMSNNAQVTGSGWFILNDPSGDVTTTGTGNAGTIAARMAIAAPYAASTGPRTQNFNIAAGTSLAVSGAIINTGEGTTYTGSISKSGAGTLILSGANTYTGTTAVNEGTLLVNGTHTGGGTYTVASGATLGGSGDIGAATVALYGRMSPGNSIESLATGQETWHDGGSFLLEIDDAQGTAGASPGWDLLEVNGPLVLTGINPGQFTIELDSLASGALPNFSADPYSSYAWDFVHASGGIVDFDAGMFTLDTSGFPDAVTNAFGAGQFAVVSLDDKLWVTFTAAVPEPSTFLLAALGLLGLGWLGRRRRGLAR